MINYSPLCCHQDLYLFLPLGPQTPSGLSSLREKVIILILTKHQQLFIFLYSFFFHKKSRINSPSIQALLLLKATISYLFEYSPVLPKYLLTPSYFFSFKSLSFFGTHDTPLSGVITNLLQSLYLTPLSPMKCGLSQVSKALFFFTDMLLVTLLIDGLNVLP